MSPNRLPLNHQALTVVVGGGASSSAKDSITKSDLTKSVAGQYDPDGKYVRKQINDFLSARKMLARSREIGTTWEILIDEAYFAVILINLDTVTIIFMNPLQRPIPLSQGEGTMGVLAKPGIM